MQEDIRISVRVGKELHALAKAEAALRGITITELVRELLVMELKKIETLKLKLKK